MAEVTSESLVMAQQVSSLSSSVSLRLWQRVEEEGLPCQGMVSHPRAQRGAAACRGLCGASLCNSAGVYVQRELWCEDRHEPGRDLIIHPQVHGLIQPSKGGIIETFLLEAAGSIFLVHQDS